jgi:hypothetical protein
VYSSRIELGWSREDNGEDNSVGYNRVMLDIIGYTRSGRVEQNRIREGLLLKKFFISGS